MQRNISPVGVVAKAANSALRDELRQYCDGVGLPSTITAIDLYKVFRLRGPFSDSLAVLTGVSDSFQRRLQFISSTTELPPHLVRVLLTQTMCLKKWRGTVVNGLAANRAKQAKLGFVDRQLSVAQKAEAFLTSNLYSTLRPILRRLLAGYLPPVEAHQGRFGPGACEERYTHYQRWIHLGRWCEASPDAEVWTQSWMRTEHRDFWNSAVRLCAVPKDWNKDRLITVEPAFAGFCQQAVREDILASLHRGTLRGTAMDLGYVDSQSIQRTLCVTSSGKASHLATIDLKDASDNVPWAVVQDIFPDWLVERLWLSRSPHYREGGHSSRVASFAGMGNATTFPIETVFFTALVEGIAVLHSGSIRRARSVYESIRGRLVSVFGDDIICDGTLADQLTVLADLPVVINVDKSFGPEREPQDDSRNMCIWQGSTAYTVSPLRESCGIFTYNGVDVTPLRVNGPSRDEVATAYWAGLAKRALRLSPFAGILSETVFPSDYFCDLARAFSLLAKKVDRANVLRATRRLSGLENTLPRYLAADLEWAPTRWSEELQRRQARVFTERTVYKMGDMESSVARPLAPAVLLGIVTYGTCRGKHVFKVPIGTKTVCRWQCLPEEDLE